MIGKFPKKQELRRQKVLQSKVLDDLYLIIGKNQVARCFELVGIHDVYSKEKEDNESFNDFYTRCMGKNRMYHYQNKGIAVIRKRIAEKRMRNELDGINYKISRKSMTYGITMCLQCVRVYESSAVVLGILLEYILEDENLTSIYRNDIKKDTMEEYFAFQNTLLEKKRAEYATNGGIITANQICFDRLRTQLEVLIGD